MSDSVTISDRWRTPVIAQGRKDGGIGLRGHFTNLLALSDSELERLFSFARDLGVLRRFSMAAKSPQADE
jgi:hypothetical protein